MATTIRNKNLFCLNCGGEFALQYPIPVDELSKKIKAFDILHKDCKPTWKEPEADQSKSGHEKAIWWIQNGERGMSSDAMWYCFMGVPQSTAHPYDPDDFKRCWKLLEAVPEWKNELHKLKTLSKVWINLVDNWDKLTDMYEKNCENNWENHKEIGMYEFMQECINC